MTDGPRTSSDQTAARRALAEQEAVEKRLAVARAAARAGARGAASAGPHPADGKTESPAVAPTPRGGPAPPAVAPPRLARWRKAAIASALALAAGLAIMLALPGGGTSDQVTEQQKQTWAAAFQSAGPVALAVVKKADTEAAIEGMAVTVEKKQELREAVAAGRERLVWLTLWDTVAEDGDVVHVQSGTFSQTVPLLHAPKRIAIPEPPTGVVNITGGRDGGGGITIGILSGETPVNLPFLKPGQVVGVPVFPGL